MPCCNGYSHFPCSHMLSAGLLHFDVLRCAPFLQTCYSEWHEFSACVFSSVRSGYGSYTNGGPVHKHLYFLCPPLLLIVCGLEMHWVLNIMSVISGLEVSCHTLL